MTEHEEKALAESGNWKFAHEWHEGLDLSYYGVNIGEVITYDMLRILGRVWLRHQEEKQNRSLSNEIGSG